MVLVECHCSQPRPYCLIITVADDLAVILSEGDPVFLVKLNTWSLRAKISDNSIYFMFDKC